MSAEATAPVQGLSSSNPQNTQPPIENVAQNQNPPPQVDPKVQRRLQHMAQQERAFRAQQAKFAQERDAFAAQQAEVQKQHEAVQKYEAWKNRVSNGDYSALEEAGVTKDQITNWLMNQPDPSMKKMAEMSAKLHELEQKNESMVSEFQKAQESANEEALFQLGREAGHTVKSNPDQFPFISMSGQDGIDASVALIKHVYETEKYLMSPDEAVQKVEKFYEDEYRNIAENPKIKAKFTPVAPPTMSKKRLPPGEMPFSQAVRAAAPTLSRDQLPSQSMPKKSSDAERRMRAIQAYEENRRRNGF